MKLTKEDIRLILTALRTYFLDLQHDQKVSESKNLEIMNRYFEKIDHTDRLIRYYEGLEVFAHET